MTDRNRPALRRIIAQDGSMALDAQEFLDGSGGVSYSAIFENSPQLRKEIEDAEDERRRVQDCSRFGKTTADRAVIGTSRRDVTRTGIK